MFFANKEYSPHLCTLKNNFYTNQLILKLMYTHIFESQMLKVLCYFRLRYYKVDLFIRIKNDE